MKVSILTIGDEILIGQIVDTNSAWMGEHLNLIGAKIQAIHSVGDERDDILRGLRAGLGEADVVLVTGGLGPTKDDITKKTIADFLNTEMIFHKPTWERIQQLFQKWGRSTTPAHREQCYMPASATILFNKMGTAPGMWFETEEGKVIVSMPGVPYEMKYLMEFEVLPRIKNYFPGKPIAHRTILTVGEGESRIALRLEALEKSLPPFIKLAYLPGLGRVRLRLTGIANNGEDIITILEEKSAEIGATIPELIFGHEKEELAEAVGKMLRQRNLTISTAESCTGGLVAHKITEIPGSSAYYMGSLITYSNEAKIKQLGVGRMTLEKFGAVSEETVKEMVRGLLDTMGTDIGISISGIAGPGGGTPEKPVGTIWMAIANKENLQTIKLQLGKDRLRNIQYTAVQALNMVRKFLLEFYPIQNSKKEGSVSV